MVVFSAVIPTVCSPVTTAAISPELSWFGGLRVIVYENRTGTVTFERKLFTTISRIGWLICQRSTLVANKLTHRISSGLKSRKNAFALSYLK
jgi:hypothetical protein